jgi:hypothetical protein
MRTHPPPSRDRNAVTTNLNPSGVDGMTIEFSPLSWAHRPPGQVASNQARKVRVSLTPVTKIVLLGRCPAGKQVLATWACSVVSSVLSMRPDMWSDMRLLYVSHETAVSDWVEPMAVGLSDPLC